LSVYMEQVDAVGTDLETSSASRRLTSDLERFS